MLPNRGIPSTMRKTLRWKHRRTLLHRGQKNNVHVGIKNVNFYESGRAGSGRARIFRTAHCFLSDEIDFFRIPTHLVVGYSLRGIYLVQAGFFIPDLVHFFSRLRNTELVVHRDFRDGRNSGFTLN